MEDDSVKTNYSIRKGKKNPLLHATTWMKLKNLLSERSQTQKNILYSSTYMKILKGQVLFLIKISSKDFIYPHARNNNKNNKNKRDEKHMEQWFARPCTPGNEEE